MLQIAERKKLHQNLMSRLKKEPAALNVSQAQEPFAYGLFDPALMLALGSRLLLASFANNDQ